MIKELKVQLEKLKEKELEEELNMMDQGIADEEEKKDGAAEGHTSEADDSSPVNDGAANEEVKSDEAKKDLLSSKEPKSLLQTGPGYGTLYKTPGKDNQNQKSTKFKQFNFEKRTFTKYSCPLSHFDGYNLWLLKPTHLNRGRGIHVFNDLNTLHKLIKEYCLGKDEEGW